VSASVAGDHHGHSHGHAHTLVHAEGPGDRRRLGIALALITAFLVGEVVAAVFAESIALLADAGHMLVDALALAASLIAARLAARPAAGSLTFGYKRAEILSALANGVTLLVVAVAITVEAVHRLIDPADVAGGVVLVVAAVGIAVNLTAVRVLTGSVRRSLNLEGALRHVLTDLYAFAGTFLAGLIIVTTGFERADPVASLGVAGLMLPAAWGLLSASVRVLLEAAPAGIDPADLTRDLRADPRVESVHDVHVWEITSGFPALSAHVLVERGADCHAVRRDLEALLATHYSIEHTTLQVDHAAEHLLSIEQRPAADG
jgi:cobalt-zinc-cadmium efflux system protein